MTDAFFNNLVQLIAKAVAATAGSAVLGLVKAFGADTEPDFTAIVGTYNRMLAIALLLVGAFVAMALIERILGGPRGAGWDVVPRALASTSAAVVALVVVRYLAGYASLLSTAWSADFLTDALGLVSRIGGMYSDPTATVSAMGTGAAIAVGVITVFLAVLVYVELVLRAALILVTTVFIPLVCVMWIWPRTAAAATHLVEFLAVLLLSKFVIVTAVYVGFSLAVHGLTTPVTGPPAASGMMTGLATLVLAAFSPVLLVQGIRFSHTGAGSIVRSGAATGARAAGATTGKALGLGLGKRLSPLPRQLGRRMRARQRSQAPASGAGE
jgi:hypothetical protein